MLKVSFIFWTLFPYIQISQQVVFVWSYLWHYCAIYTFSAIVFSTKCKTPTFLLFTTMESGLSNFSGTLIIYGQLPHNVKRWPILCCLQWVQYIVVTSWNWKTDYIRTYGEVCMLQFLNSFCQNQDFFLNSMWLTIYHIIHKFKPPFRVSVSLVFPPLVHHVSLSSLIVTFLIPADVTGGK